MFETYVHEITLFQMTQFEVDALEIVPFGNTQKRIEIESIGTQVQLPGG